MTRYKTEMLVVGSVVMAAMGQTMIKFGLVGQGPWGKAAIHWPLQIALGVLLGLCVYGIGTVLWFAAVAQGNISYLYPLAAINYVLMGLVGHFVLHENMGALRWCGIAVMAFGIAMLSRTNEGVTER